MEKEIYVINEKNGPEDIVSDNIHDVSESYLNPLLLHTLGLDEKNRRILIHSKEAYIISIINQFNRIKLKLETSDQLRLIAASLGECGNAFLDQNVIKALFDLYAINNNNLASVQLLCNFYGCCSSLNKINDDDFIQLVWNQIDIKNLKMNLIFSKNSSIDNEVKKIAEKFLIKYFNKVNDNE